MEVELLPLFPKLPHGPPESANPICRGYRLSVFIEPFWVLPDIVVGVRVFLQKRLLEPFVLVARMVENKVEDNFQTLR